MESQTEFRKQVREVLEHLYDTAYLETHPLLAQFSNAAVDSRLTRAQKLRSLLKDAIETLRPQEGSPSGSPEWRSYLALRYRYVQGMSQGETEIELGISLRQLQRELHKGLDAVAALLWEKRKIASTGAGDEIQELEKELDQWPISRQICAVETLVDDTRWMLKPLLGERGVDLHINLPPNLAPGFVDATLTRQALFKVLRMLVRAAEPGTLVLSGREEDEQTALVLQQRGHINLETETDWQAAQSACQHQGIRLEAKSLPDGGTEIVFALPRAAQARILVIDDNAAIHQLFERYLAPHHYEVIHAYSGQEALELAVGKRPAAITLDVMMPNVDGWQVLRGLAGDPKTAGIPVVVCSVLNEPDLAFSLGARAYLKKPVDRLELVATLARLLSPEARGAAVPRSTPGDS
ncbi:MAG TPA: response regulator [Anaerolineae bacterium]